MKKRILILFSIFILFLAPNIVKAASANVQISAPSSVYVGETVTVSVTVSSSVSLGHWDYLVNYDDSKLSYVSTTADSAQSAYEDATGGGRTSVTYTWTFKASNAGNASFNVSSISVVSWDPIEELDINGSTSASINVIKPSSGGNGGSTGGNNGGHGDYKYSDDNNLSSLNIEGFDIDFDSSVTEYSLSVPNDTKKVKIGATANDGNASVSGIGDYDVKEGNNEIKIVVTAENGDTKTYTINVNVKELSPIEVKVNDKTYSVVRKSDKLPRVNATYKASTILIKGESVPCYHSDITDIYLVGLIDEKGKIVLYNYDSKNDKFIEYNEINIGGLYISLIDTNESPKGYTKGLVKIGDKEYNGFLKDGSYSLLYGINLETGEKNYYSYDASESTIQKILTSATKSVDFSNSKIIIFSLIGLCIFEFIMIIACVISKNKQLKKYLGSKLDVGTLGEKVVDENIVSADGVIDSDDAKETDSEENEFATVDESDNDENVDSLEKKDSDEEVSEEDKVDDSKDESDVSYNTEEIEDSLGHTALISKSVSNVYNNTKNRKESIKERKALRKNKKKDDDDMFKF